MTHTVLLGEAAAFPHAPASAGGSIQTFWAIAVLLGGQRDPSRGFSGITGDERVSGSGMTYANTACVGRCRCSASRAVDECACDPLMRRLP
jgi:hypothetical protein